MERERSFEHAGDGEVIVLHEPAHVTLLERPVRQIVGPAETRDRANEGSRRLIRSA
jgi:hypothetical protein